MAQFKKGDIVRVRLDTVSPYRGRIGTVYKEFIKNPPGELLVEFESKGLTYIFQVAEQDLEVVSQK
jgi:hypothetical protein